jgi:hypothetical protein
LRDERPIEDIVVTVRQGNGPLRQQSVTRKSPSTFVSSFAFEPGPTRITVIARAPDGTRRRAALSLDIPR